MIWAEILSYSLECCNSSPLNCVARREVSFLQKFEVKAETASSRVILPEAWGPAASQLLGLSPPRLVALIPSAPSSLCFQFLISILPVITKSGDIAHSRIGHASWWSAAKTFISNLGVTSDQAGSSLLAASKETRDGRPGWARSWGSGDSRE